MLDVPEILLAAQSLDMYLTLRGQGGRMYNMLCGEEAM